MKNHFYSNLRKTLRRFIKEKLNYSKFNFNILIDEIKEKIKAYYSLIFIKDKILDSHINKKINKSNENSVISTLHDNK